MLDAAFFDTAPSRLGTDSIKYMTPPAPARADTIPMWVADMDFLPPPCVKGAVEKTLAQGIYGYTAVTAEYWEAVRAWIERRMGWETKAEWFVGVPNVLAGVSAAICAMTAEQDAVLLCEPVYYPFARIIRGLHRQLSVSPLREENGRYTFDFADIERKITEDHVRLLLLCSPHNPVGRVWTREELAELGHICCRHGVRILSDEIHADLVFTPHTPIASISGELANCTVTAMAPTKTFNLAGLPCAHLIIPNRQVRQAVSAACGAAGHGAANLLALAAARAAYREGDEWLDGLLDYLRGNYEELRAAFTEGSGVTVGPLEGTYLVWLDCRAFEPDAEKLNRFFLKEAGLWLDGGEMFGAGGAGFMRLNIACPRSTLREAIARLHSALQR